MRNTLFCLLMVGCISTFAQNGTTFKVENLSKPEKLLFIKSYEDIYKGLILSDLKIYPYEIKEKNINVPFNIIAKSEAPDSLVNYNYNSFFYGMYQAYANHRPFVLSPDMIWLLINQGFARHVNANQESMRDLFVDFSGKQSLIVKANKKLEKVASEITIMEAMKPYFEFIVMYIVCGIPEITLEGTPEDWEKVLDKARRLKEYKLEWWISELEPLLEEFVKASKGEVNKDFWRNMFKYHSQKKYGAPDIIDGWIVKFFPYDKNGRRNNLKQLEGGNSLPDEIVKVDLKYLEVRNDTIIETPLELWSGFIGLQQNKDNFALRPQISWMIRKKDIGNKGLLSKLRVEAQEEGIGSGISIKVKEFPPVLLELKEIKSLQIEFTNEIDIPNELSEVKIGKLELSGKIAGKGIERIKELFPNTEIKINGARISK